MLRIAKDCAAKGHDVTIYTGQWRGDKPDNIEVVLLPSKGLLNHQRHRSLIHAMQQALLQKPVDYVLGFNRMSGLDTYYAADPCFIERAHQERGWWYRLTGRYRFFAQSEAAVFGSKQPCKILLLAPTEKGVFQRWYQTQDNRFYQLPPSIPQQKFEGLDRVSARNKLRQEFGLPTHAKVVLLVGSAFHRKGLDRAILALAALPENIRANTWLIAVGEDEAKPMQLIAASSHVEKHLIMAAARHDVPELMLGSDILVHPARSELAGLVIIEAMTAGLPVIVTENCGYATHIAQSSGGVVLPSPYQQMAMDKALQDLLTETNLDSIGQRGEHYVKHIANSNSATTEADWIEQFAQEKLAGQAR